MDVCKSLFDPATESVDIRVSGWDLHSMLWRIFLQCIAYLIGSLDNGMCSFHLGDISDDVIARVRNAFRKMNINVDIISAHDDFRDPHDILHTDLDSRVTHISQLARKIRFVFVLPRSTCSSAALSSV